MTFLLAAIGLSVAAQAAETNKPCTAAKAVRTSVVAINEAPEKWVGRCVALVGPAGSIEMYSGVEGMYLSRRFGSDGNFDKQGLKHRIGLYSDDNGIRSSPLYTTGVPKIALIGTVDTCERMQAAADARARRDNPGIPAIIMMGGYCHYYRGPVVRASSYVFDPKVRYARFTGEAARARFGNLVAAPADWPGLDKLNDIAVRFRQAVKSGDRDAVVALHDIDPAKASEHEHRVLRSILDEPGTPFASLRSGRDAPFAVFVTILPAPYNKAREDAARHPSGTICYCRTVDCSKLWPISSEDAGNRRDRPFVCTRTRWRKDGVALQTYLETGGLLEPLGFAAR